MFGRLLSKKEYYRIFNLIVISFICFVFTVFIEWVRRTEVGQDLEYKIQDFANFKVRQFFTSVPVDNRLKIVGFGDGDISLLKRPEFMLEEWEYALRRILAQNPQIVLIDKIFATYFDPNKYVSKFAKSMQNTKIVVGSFFSESKIPLRNEVDKILANQRFNREWKKSKEKGISASLNVKILQNNFIYGPDASISEAFSNLGHIHYAGRLQFYPFVFSKDVLIPHITMHISKNFVIKENEFFVDDLLVPSDKFGKANINLLHPDQIYSRIIPMVSLFNKQKTPNIQEGDVVVILPNLYTGNTDFHESPFGYVPGGTFLISIMNSILIKQLLKKSPFDWFYLAILAFVGVWLAFKTSVRLFWFSFIFSTLFVIVVGLLIFIKLNLILPWLAGSIIFSFVSLIIFVDRSILLENKSKIFDLLEEQKKFYERELKDAAVMAQAFRPDFVPDWPQLLFASYHKPLHDASGDWFAFEKSQNENLLHIMMCDITGHGVQAALVVSECKTTLNNLRKLRNEIFDSENFLSEFMIYLNEVLCMQGNGKHTTTFLGLTFNRTTLELTYVAAGHPSPVLLKAANQARKPKLLQSRHNPLGSMLSVMPELKKISLEPKDEIIAFTDGIPLLENWRVLKDIPQLNENNKKALCEQLYNSTWQIEIEKKQHYPDDDVSIIWFAVA